MIIRRDFQEPGDTSPTLNLAIRKGALIDLATRQAEIEGKGPYATRRRGCDSSHKKKRGIGFVDEVEGKEFDMDWYMLGGVYSL